MKNVSSTMNMTGFESRDNGFSLTNESRSVLVDVRLLRKRGEVGLFGFEVIVSEPVYAFLEEFENRPQCEEGKECENDEQEYTAYEYDRERDAVRSKANLCGSLAIDH